MEKFSNFFSGFYGENVVNLRTRKEIVCRKCGELTFYGDFKVKLVWRLLGVFMK